jgi:hypothetical protein
MFSRSWTVHVNFTDTDCGKLLPRYIQIASVYIILHTVCLCSWIYLKLNPRLEGKSLHTDMSVVRPAGCELLWCALLELSCGRCVLPFRMQASAERDAWIQNWRGNSHVVGYPASTTLWLCDLMWTARDIYAIVGRATNDRLDFLPYLIPCLLLITELVAVALKFCSCTGGVISCSTSCP